MKTIPLYFVFISMAAFGQKGTYDSLSEALKEPLNVKELILSGKNISELPEEIRGMKNLVKLSVPNNKSLVVASLIEKLTDLKKLKELDISSCGITSLPKEIGKLKQLRVLKLGANKLSSIPNELGTLTNLKELVFSQYLDDFRGFSLDEKRKVLKLVPDCKVLLVDYFGAVHGNYRLGQKEVRVTSENVDSI